MEDDPYDAELIQSVVRRSGVDAGWTRVDNEPDFIAALAKSYDAVITDFKMPSFSALRVLEILEGRRADLPALVVTGALDDELAADCIKRGASDYLLKDRLARLGDALQAAVSRHRAGREKRQADERLLSEARARVVLYSMLSASVSRALPGGAPVGPGEVLSPLLEPNAVPALFGLRYERSGLPIFESWKAGRKEKGGELRRALESPGGDLGSLAFFLSPEALRNPETEALLDQASAVFLDYLVRTKAERDLVASMAEKDELLREIHHRVKNNLAAIAGLLSLEAGRSSAGEAQELLLDLEGQIRSMALVHDMLYSRSDFTGIDFDEYARELALRVAQSVGADTRTFAPVIECAGLLVPLESAVTLGIIVSELYSRSALRTIEGGHVSAALRAWKAEAGRGGWRVEYIESADAEAKPPTKNLDLAWIIVRQLGGVVSEVGNGLRVVVELAPGEVGERGAEKGTPPAESERRPEEIRTAPALRSSPPIGDAIFAQEEMAAVRTLRDQAADKELESFFYAVTHDLRAPLRAIGGFATILAEEEGARLSAEGLRILGAIRGNVSRMENLIEDLLTFARLGKAEIVRVAVDMAALALTAFEESVPEGSRGRIDFTLSAMPGANGDPRLLRQVWANLISNAVKFSSGRERAHLWVEGRRATGELVFSVLDDGVGFDMKYYSKLFGIFQRLHSARDFEGSGMGLAYVQRAIIRQGGRVWAEGEVGKGARFSFSLPLP